MASLIATTNRCATNNRFFFLIHATFLCATFIIFSAQRSTLCLRVRYTGLTLGSTFISVRLPIPRHFGKLTTGKQQPGAIETSVFVCVRLSVMEETMSSSL